MRMIKNKNTKVGRMSYMSRKISTKILGLAIVLAMVGMLSNLFNYLTMREMYKASLVVIEDSVTSIRGLEDVKSNLDNLQKKLLLLCIVTDNEAMEDIKIDISVMKGELTTSIDKIQKSLVKQREIDTFNDFYSNYSLYLEVYDKILALSHSNDKDSAIELVKGELAQISKDIDINMDSMNILNTTNLIRAKEEQSQSYNRYINVTIGSAILIILVLVICVIVTRKTIINTTVRATKKLQNIIKNIEEDQGDLTDRIKVESKDEIGQLVLGINKFIDTLQKIIKEVKHGSTDLQENVDNVVKQVGSANEKISDTSATMEELAAGMEEVSATVEEMNTSSNNFVNSMINMANKATEGSEFAKEIKVRAEKLREEAINSKNTTYHMVNQISEILLKSMENSKEVEKINTLTENILDITDQTNLLALNASIEAARAGEAGKGFAVVADQIRILADTSKNTANNIQQISGLVTNAVNELASNANSMLDYIKSTVLLDYEKLANTGEQYNKDATDVDDIMLSFAAVTAKLQGTVEQMNLSMEGISVTVEESAKGISNVAENASDLVNVIGSIQQEMEHSEGISKRLKQKVDVFTSI